jgi:hypothetical protein
MKYAAITELNTLRSNDPTVTTFLAEASELGWPVGRCPKILQTTLGNGQPLKLIRIDYDAEGEAIKANFKQRFGCIGLIVFNV